jgi:hypothetical protein
VTFCNQNSWFGLKHLPQLREFLNPFEDVPRREWVDFLMEREMLKETLLYNKSFISYPTTLNSLTEIVKALPNLQNLNLGLVSFGDEGFDLIKDLHSLAHLIAIGSHVTFKGILKMQNLQLKSLGLFDCHKLDDRAFELIVAQFPHLEQLYLGNMRHWVEMSSAAPAKSLITDDTFTESLPKLIELQRLAIGLTQCTKNGLLALTKCKKLKGLSIHQGAIVDDEVLLKLATELKELAFLKIAGCKAPSNETQKKFKKLAPQCDLQIASKEEINEWSNQQRSIVVKY